MTATIGLWLLTKLKALGNVLSAVWAWLMENPWRWSLVIVPLLLWRLWAIDGDRDKWRTDYRALVVAGERLEAQNKIAGETGVAVAESVKGEVEDGNERARAAAAGSDDALKSGFDSLRRENRRPDTPPR